jgi:large subunit ribosomal protein L24
MKKEFSNHWISSTQARKQRKYRANAPLHIKANYLSGHLSKELRTKYGKRSLRIRVGDRVKIMRGQFRNIEGKVDRVDLKRTKLYIGKAEISKKDGSKALYPIDPSNVMITELLLEDKKRSKNLQAKQKK